MKAQDFLNLVGRMLTTQQDYYKARKQRDGSDYGLLIKAKELEKKVLAVVQEGRLEPDDASSPLSATLDLSGELRPTEAKQGSLFEQENDNNGKNS